MKEKYGVESLFTVYSDNRILTESFKIDNVHQIAPEFDEEERIYILAHQVNDFFPAHAHEFFELTYVWQGELMNVIDGNEFYMASGDLAILNPEAVQCIRPLAADTLLLNICIKEEAFERTMNAFVKDENAVAEFLRGEHQSGRNYMLFATGRRAGIRAVIADSVQEYKTCGYRQSFGLEALLLLLFVKLERTNEFSYYGMDEKALGIFRYVKEHCYEYSIAEIAEQLGYHANYLSEYIKKHTGRNCRDIMRETKLEEAVKQLEETEFDVYDISENCGYTSPSHFFRIFKQHYGMTPRQYREKSRAR